MRSTKNKHNYTTIVVQITKRKQKIKVKQFFINKYIKINKLKNATLYQIFSKTHKQLN